MSSTINASFERLRKATHPRNWGSGRRPADPFLADPDEPDDAEPESSGIEKTLPLDNPSADPREGNKDQEQKDENNSGNDLAEIEEGEADSSDKANKQERTDGNSFRTRVHQETRLTSWSMLWSFIICWSIGPQFFIALWDRVMKITGHHQLISGDEPMGFGLMNGPGIWFRDTVGTHWETGTMGRLFLCAAFGIIPLAFYGASREWTKYRTLFRACAIIPVCVFLLGISYAQWEMTYEDLYIVTLFATAFYCFAWFQEIKYPGMKRCLVFVPIASVLSGFMYASNAVF